MKIHSKFKDYYDSALGSFTESDVVFKRIPSIETHIPMDFPSLGEDFHGLIHSPRSYLAEHNGLQIDPFMRDRAELYSVWLGFCGKYYPFVTPSGTFGELVWSRYDKSVLKDPMDDQYLSALFREGARLNFESSDFATISKFSRFDIDFKMSIGMKIPDNLISDNFKNPEETIFWKDEAFERFGPIFLAVFPVQTKYIKDRDKARIWIFRNPCLKTIGFQKVKDPYTALWEIEHWIDSHARPDDAVVPVGDDLTRLQAYGFDKKTSFRKAKEK